MTASSTSGRVSATEPNWRIDPCKTPPRYDGPAFDPKGETLPLEFFEPMVAPRLRGAEAVAVRGGGLGRSAAVVLLRSKRAVRR